MSEDEQPSVPVLPALPREVSDVPEEANRYAADQPQGSHVEAFPPTGLAEPLPSTPAGRVLFHAFKQSDGTYSVTLTETGVRNFETALAIADDLGSETTISQHSTIADIMERTATREELSAALREDRPGLLAAARRSVLQRKLGGSLRPTVYQRTLGHLGKIIILAVIGVWTLWQFWTAVQDIAAIPGILANMPNDIIHLHPTSTFTDVGNRIADAGDHTVLGIAGACLTYILGKLLQPLGRIYRMDQILPGERLVVSMLDALLRRYQRPRARG